MEFTKSEIGILKILWAANEPLTCKEILQSDTDKSLEGRSIHYLINGLVRKEAVCEAGRRKTGRIWERQYKTILSYGTFCMNMLTPVWDVIDYKLFFRLLLDDKAMNEEMLKEIKSCVKNAYKGGL